MNPDTAVRSCSRLADLLERNVIYLEEYHPNLIMRIISQPMAVQQLCLRTVPIPLLLGVRDYFDVEIKQVDYMPNPRSFLVRTDSPQLIEDKKREMQPMYVALDHLLNEHIRDVFIKAKPG